ncbi:MAG: hypothetical protein NVSMB18_20920 [Acetobacteraceae bacterium]
MRRQWLTKCYSALVLRLLGLAAAPASGSVIVTTVGTPAYVSTDFHLFTATTDFSIVLPALLPPPAYKFDPTIGIIPGAPQAGPYDNDIALGLASAGYREATRFTPSEYSGGNGVYLAYMLIPTANAPIGSSPDYSSGPILPNSLFPINVNFTTYQRISSGSPSLFDIPPTSG